MHGAVIIVAAGEGQRMGSPVRKQYLTLNGLPILARSVRAFTDLEYTRQLVVAVPPGEVDVVRKILRSYCPPALLTLVEGGQRRQDSVFKALQEVHPELGLVCIHDGVRPLVSQKLILSVLEAAAQYGAAVPAIPVTDTLKEITLQGTVKETLFRYRLRRVQTPQAFRRELILQAYEKAYQLGLEGTDDAYFLELLEFPVYLVPGDPINLKITTPHDILVAEAYLRGGR